MEDQFHSGLCIEPPSQINKTLTDPTSFVLRFDYRSTRSMSNDKRKTGLSNDSNRRDDSDRDDDCLTDEMFERMDDDFELGGMREKRMEELRREILRKQEMQDNDHGTYIELKDEKQVIRITASSKMAVVHFFHSDFRTCEIMNRHLEKLAAKYFSTRFLKVDVANVPWLVTKLEIKVLPCVIAFVDGVTKDRIIGFEGVSEESGNQLSTWALELRLKQAGAIKSDEDTNSTIVQRSIMNPSMVKEDVDDWDD